MPYRRVILAQEEYYHIFNRSLGSIPIFRRRREVSLFLQAMGYYLNPHPPVKFSTYRKNRKKYQINFADPLVKIIAYCLMPTHFHFILKQIKEKGVKTYIQRLVNSYSHYFNTKNERRGPLFEGPFKAVRIESEEQLWHLSRYIHLNPVTEYIVEKPEEYLFSSYRIYIGKEKSSIVDSTIVLSAFSSPKDYEEFTLARKDYQREIDKIKHLLLE